MMMMDDAPPPTVHILRPHHVALLSVLMLIFKEPETRRIPAQYLLHLYRALLHEVAEVSQRKSYDELMNTLSNGPSSNTDDGLRFIEALRSVHQDLGSPENMTNFFSNLPSLFVEKNEDEPPILMRRSVYGYFCRRCFVSFIKLSFSGVVQLQQDFKLWREGNTTAGYQPVDKDQLNNSDPLIFKTQADKKSWAKADAYEIFEQGFISGDDNVATENLRRFFEQHFHDSNDSGMRQHALLNLIRMHYIRGEITATRKLLAEAISVARTSGDKTILQHCLSIQNRLHSSQHDRKPPLNELQPDVHPLEVLFDVKKLIDPDNGQPLVAAFTKIFQAVGLYNQRADSQAFYEPEGDQYAHHAAQSVVWTLAGCDGLASIEEDIVIAHTAVGENDNNRITVQLNKAYKRARQGQYNHALAMLLDPDVWNGLSIDDYNSWAHEIWHILALRATRRGQMRLYKDFLLTQRPPGSFNARDYVFHVPGVNRNKLQGPLQEVLQMRRVDQATLTVDQLLKALWHCEYLNRYGLYRTALVLLADIHLELGVPEKSLDIMESILPQIIVGHDLEQRAFGCFVYARCIIAAKDLSAPMFQEAMSFLRRALADYEQLELLESQLDVLYFMSVVYHNMGAIEGRDAAAKSHLDLQAQQQRNASVVVEEETRQILDTVQKVGIALAGRFHRV